MLHPSGALGISACPAAKSAPNQSRSIESKVKTSLLKKASTSSKVLQLWATEISQLSVLSHGRGCYQKSWAPQVCCSYEFSLFGSPVIAYDGGATLCKQLRCGHWSQSCSTVRMLSSCSVVYPKGLVVQDSAGLSTGACTRGPVQEGLYKRACARGLVQEGFFFRCRVC